jgi:hypothetical protein
MISVRAYRLTHSLGLVFLFLVLCTRLAGAAVTGKIEGTVVDRATKEPVAGVTVIASSPALQGEQVAITDEHGQYVITELPPGIYVVRFYVGDVMVERAGIPVGADTTLRVNMDMPMDAVSGETVIVTDRPPSVDVGSAQVQTKITKEIVNNTPIPGGIENRRGYESALALVPTASFDVNPAFGGSTGNENAFLINGFNSTQVQRGFLGTQVTLEFLEETNAVIAGYNAEYGRSTGGVVNLVTKSGSNEFKGDVWSYMTPYQMTPPAVGGAAQAVASTNKLLRTTDFGFDLGGPIQKDRLWFYVGFGPSINQYEATSFRRRRVANDVPAGTGAYPGDTQTSGPPACPDFLASPDLCPTGTTTAFVLEDLPGTTQKFHQSRDIWNWIAKLDLRLTDRHHLSLTYIGSPTTSSGIPGGTGPVTTREFSELDNIHDVILGSTSKLLDQRLEINGNVGIHWENYLATFPTAVGNGPRISYYQNESLFTFEDVPECAPTMVNGRRFDPCPVTGYSVGGFGSPLAPQTAERLAGTLAATYYLKAAGSHALKVGLEAEDNTFDNRPVFTGGATYRVSAPNGAGERTVERREFARLNPDGTIDELPDGLRVNTGVTSQAIYLRDSWNTGFLPDLTLNYGLRWEGVQVHDPQGNAVIRINDNLAPRLGFAYDFTGKGHGRLFGNYGRYYEAVPVSLADSFGNRSPTKNIAAMPGTCKQDGNLIDISTCQFRPLTPGDLSRAALPEVSSVLKGQYVNETLLGGQLDVGNDLVVGATLIRRSLGRMLEDSSPDDSGTFIVGNIGENQDAAIKQLEREIAQTTDPTQLAALQGKLERTRGLATLPKPTRNYNALILTAQRRMTDSLVLLASYAYSRTRGNAPGLFDSTYGASPNFSSIYDYRDAMINTYGPLTGDRPHNFKLSAGYRIPINRRNVVTLGGSYTLISGTPINVLGLESHSNAATIFILPRGSGGRLPAVSSASLHVGYGVQATEHTRFDFYFDVFNLFNEQTVTGVNNLYTSDVVDAIPNGKPSDLANLMSKAGKPVTTNPNYGQPTAYQSPLSLRFGVRASF